jgi:hypothetical protein
MRKTVTSKTVTCDCCGASAVDGWPENPVVTVQYNQRDYWRGSYNPDERRYDLCPACLARFMGELSNAAHTVQTNEHGGDR